MQRILVSALLVGLAAGTGAGGIRPAAALAAEVQVVTLTQRPCLFVEGEVEPKPYTSSGRQDCEAINEATEGQRELKTLRLKPGRTVFRVTNEGVPYELGFVLRGRGLGQVTLPSVSGGGLLRDMTKEFVVDLKPGRYVYFCPLNPTPQYPVIVG